MDKPTPEDEDLIKAAAASLYSGEHAALDIDYSISPTHSSLQPAQTRYASPSLFRSPLTPLRYP